MENTEVTRTGPMYPFQFATPKAGTSPRILLNKNRYSVANTKLGMVEPSVDKTIRKRSTNLFWRSAARIPAAMPKIIMSTEE